MALTKAERNDAITKLYREGWTQKGIAEKFRIDKGQISRVIGAKERSAKVVSHNNAIKSELTARIFGANAPTLGHSSLSIEQSALMHDAYLDGVVTTQELKPAHEEVIRKAPKPLQVVLTPLWALDRDGFLLTNHCTCTTLLYESIKTH